MNIIKILYNMLPRNVIYYVMNFRNREEINVQRWLNAQLNDNKEILEQLLMEHSLIGRTDDETVIKILRWVSAKLKYTSDSAQYKTTEYWASITEILESMEDDCEGGATLIFCLCRVAGISYEKLHLATGAVKGGYHAWIRYKSEKYPYVSYFLDWCYWYDNRYINKRVSYFEFEKNILVPNDSKYKYFWFIVNDKGGSNWD